MIQRDLAAKSLGNTVQRCDSGTLVDCAVVRLNHDASGHIPSLCLLETSSGCRAAGNSVFCQKESLTFVIWLCGTNYSRESGDLTGCGVCLGRGKRPYGSA